MKILVTGAAGFIGRHTVKTLIKAGHDVFGVDRNDIHPSEINWSFMPINILDVLLIEAAFENFGPDAILHLAANSSLQKGIEDPVYDAQNNILGTINVLQAAKEHGCKRIVFASTSAIFHPWGLSPFTETSGIKPFTPYGVSKLACEHYIRISGLDHVILRYGNVYGPEQKPLGENILIARALAHMMYDAPFKINGDGEQVRDWIFVEDVARANLKALENENNFVGALNISSGVGHSVNTIIKMLKHETGFEGEIEHGPEIDGEIREVVMDNSNAIKLLNWNREVYLDAGLKRTVEAWKVKNEMQSVSENSC